MDGSGNDFPLSVAKVVDSDHSVVGVAFLVSDRLLVTCAHVVAASGPQNGRVSIVFPQLGGSETTAHVDPETLRGDDAEDVAFLLAEDVPPSAAPLPLGSASGRRGRRVRAFGFPAQGPREGHYGQATAGDLLPVPQGGLLQLSGANDLTVLFSGSPIVDEDTGLVFGMVTEITGTDPYARGVDIAYATPSETLWAIRPDLVTVEDEPPYQDLNSFAKEQARWFRGRDDAVREVLKALHRESRFLLLLGPSGSGKTSLVQAGVRAALIAGALPGSDRWSHQSVRPAGAINCGRCSRPPSWHGTECPSVTC